MARHRAIISRKTNLFALPAGQPVELVFDHLQPNTEYFYRLQSRKPGETAFQREARVPFSHATCRRQYFHVWHSRRFTSGTPPDERPGIVCPHIAQCGIR